MSVFTDRVRTKSDELNPEEILRNITLTGHVSEEFSGVKHIISCHGENINHILNLTSGKARIQSNIVKRFNLLLTQPNALHGLNPFEIRCCLCRKVIAYPAWYYSIRYAVSHFHYFVCFDSSSPTKPSTKCYRRE